MAVLALSMGLASCDASDGGSYNEVGLMRNTGESQRGVSGVSKSTGLEVKLVHYMPDPQGQYPICLLSARRPNPLGFDIRVEVIPIKPEDADALLNNRYVEGNPVEKRYPGIGVRANGAITVALFGSDFAVFEKGSKIGVVPTGSYSETEEYVVVTRNRWFVNFHIPKNYIDKSLLEPLAADIVNLIEGGVIVCQ